MAKQKYQYKHRRPQRRRFSFKLFLLSIFILALIVYPFIEPSMLQKDYHTVYVTALPANLKNLKIAFVSDFHKCVWFPQSSVNNIIKEVNSLGADILILGGDYAEDSDGAIEFFENLPQLHARLGVFAVVGNNDRTEPESNLEKLLYTMRTHGCTPLVNNVERVKLGQTYVYLTGADDYYNGFPDVAAVASQVSADDYVIFAGHSPDLLPDMRSARDKSGDNHWFDLALFGHTHGGQVSLFGYTPFANLRTDISARYMSGWLEENRAAVLVSNGVGTSRFPVRLLARPQIHLITLKSR